jgi:hypothetical protein
LRDESQVSVVADQALVGRTGHVTIAVRAGTKPGEVRVVVAGIPHHYLAYCWQPLAAGTPILVINDRGRRQIDVEPWRVPADQITESPNRREAY